jgi:hypothetical protein
VFEKFILSLGGEGGRAAHSGVCAGNCVRHWVLFSLEGIERAKLSAGITSPAT